MLQSSPGQHRPRDTPYTHTHTHTRTHTHTHTHAHTPSHTQTEQPLANPHANTHYIHTQIDKQAPFDTLNTHMQIHTDINPTLRTQGCTDTVVTNCDTQTHRARCSGRDSAGHPVVPVQQHQQHSYVYYCNICKHESPVTMAKCFLFCL